MADRLVSHRFGSDAPARIRTVTDYYLGAFEMPIPGEEPILAILPFPGLAGVGLPAGAGASGTNQWRDLSDRLDLYFRAGDDITIPMTFYDDNYPDIDLSDQANWKWYAHVRTGEGPSYPLVAEFIIESSYTPASATVPDGFATVTLYLPRQDNWRYGDFYWDLQGVSPEALGPEEVEPPEDDPTPGTAHTFLSGRCYVGKEVTTIPDEWPPAALTENSSTYLTVVAGHGVLVGPSGQVSG